MARAKATITPGPGPFVFGQRYHVSDIVGTWTPVTTGKAPDGYWCRVNIVQGGALVGSGFLNLSGPTQTEITLGPSPSWSGGAATATLALVGFYNGVPKDVATSVPFEIAA